MKFILCTLSNEQVKEQLSELHTKFESFETVKDVLLKLMRIKDSPISLLEGQIFTILVWISITSIVIGFIVSLVFSYVIYLNYQAKKKVEHTESSIIQNRQNASSAQQKLEDFKKMQTNLDELITSLSLSKKVDMTLKNIDIKVKFINDNLIRLHQKINNNYPYTEENIEYYEKYYEFGDNLNDLTSKYTNVLLSFNLKIIQSSEISEEDMTKITDLDDECIKLNTEIAIYYENY